MGTRNASLKHAVIALLILTAFTAAASSTRLSADKKIGVTHQFTDTIEARDNVTEYNTTYFDGNLTVKEQEVTGWHWSRGENLYYFDIGRVFISEKKQDCATCDFTEAKVTVTLRPNNLTELLAANKEPWKSISNRTEYYNDHYFWNQSDITPSELSDLNDERASIPIKVNGDTVKTTDLKEKPKNISATATLVDGQATVTVGSHSAQFTVSTQTEWNDGRFNLTSADRNSGTLGIGYRNETVCGDLKLFYRFDLPSGSVPDYSGCNNDGTNNGAARSSDGVFSTQSFEFDDANAEYVNTSMPTTNPTDFTVMAWVKPVAPGATDDRTVLGTYGGGNGVIFRVRYDMQNQLSLYTGANTRTDNLFVSESGWQFIAASYDASADETLFYINGSTETEVDSNGIIYEVAPLIGQRGDNNKYWSGNIDELQVYHREFTASELDNKYFDGRDGLFNGNYTSQTFTVPANEKPVNLSVSLGNADATGNKTWALVENDAGDSQTIGPLTTDGNNSLTGFTEGSDAWVKFNFSSTSEVGTAEVNGFTLFTEAAGDSTPPTITIKSPPAANISDSTPFLNATADETVVWRVNVDGAANQSINTTHGPLADGTHVANFYANDSAGNTAKATRTFAVDTTPPVSTDNWTQSGWVSDDQVVVSVNATDAGTNVSQISYRVDGGTWTTSAPNTSATISGDGNHTLEYNATDFVGNTEATQTEYVALDTAAPNISFNPSTTSGTTQNTWVFTNTTAEDISYLDRFEESFDGVNRTLADEAKQKTFSVNDFGSQGSLYNMTESGGVLELDGLQEIISLTVQDGSIRVNGQDVRSTSPGDGGREWWDFNLTNIDWQNHVIGDVWVNDTKEATDIAFRNNYNKFDALSFVLAEERGEPDLEGKFDAFTGSVGSDDFEDDSLSEYVIGGEGIENWTTVDSSLYGQHALSGKVNGNDVIREILRNLSGSYQQLNMSIWKKRDKDLSGNNQPPNNVTAIWWRGARPGNWTGDNLALGSSNMSLDGLQVDLNKDADGSRTQIILEKLDKSNSTVKKEVIDVTGTSPKNITTSISYFENLRVSFNMTPSESYTFEEVGGFAGGDGPDERVRAVFDEIDDIRIFRKAVNPRISVPSTGVRNHTGLSDSDYTFWSWANDSVGNFNSTDKRTVTVDAVPNDRNATLIYENVGGTTTQDAICGYDAFGDDAASVNSPPSGTLTATNHTATVTGWSSPFDWICRVTDRDGFTSNRNLNFTTTNDFSQIENATGPVNRSLQPINTSASLNVRGDAMNYTFTAVHPDEKRNTLRDDNQSTLTTTGVTGLIDKYWYWQVDSITTTLFGEAQDNSTTATNGTQSIFRNRQDRNNASRSYDRFNFTDAPTISGTCSNCDFRTGTINGNSAVNQTYNATGDFITEQTFNFDVAGTTFVELNNTYNGVRAIELENSQTHSFLSVTLDGVPQPAFCGQDNNTAVDIQGSQTRNYSIGHTCQVGGTASEDLTQIKEADAENDTHYFYNATNLNITSNATSDTTFNWSIPESELNDWDNRKAGSEAGAVDNQRFNITVNDPPGTADVIFGSNCCGSSLDTTNEKVSLYYEVSSGDTTDTAGGGGGGGGGAAPSEEAARIEDTTLSVPLGSEDTDTYRIVNLVTEQNNVDVSKDPRDKDECGLFQLQESLGSTTFGDTAEYVVPAASGGAITETSVTVEALVDMPGQDRFDELKDGNGTITCQLSTSSNQGTVNEPVLRARPPTNFLEIVREFIEDRTGFVIQPFTVCPPEVYLNQTSNTTTATGEVCQGEEPVQTVSANAITGLLLAVAALLIITVFINRRIVTRQVDRVAAALQL